MNQNKLTIQHVNQVVEIKHIVPEWKKEYAQTGTLESFFTEGDRQQWRMKGDSTYLSAEIISIRTIQEAQNAWMQP